MEGDSEVAVVSDVRYDLSVARDPKQVLAEATNAAKALQSVVSQRKGAVVFNGKQYLTFEDFQTLGRFYGVTAKIVSTEYVEIGEAKGFLARAEAINTQTGQVVSAAESMCLNDEKTWAAKPQFQLRSMSQTRASAKALRNCLAWVAVLAGYEPSVAEEMTGDEEKPKSEPIQPPKPKAAADSVTFIPADVSTKNGMGAKGPWTKYGVKSPDGDYYGSFNEEFGQLAILAKEKGGKVKLTWKASGDKGQYRDIVTIENA